jgi:uncharacterized membrane protein
MKAKKCGQETGLPLYTLVLFPKLNHFFVFLFFFFFFFEITGFYWGEMLLKYWILVQIPQFTEEEAEA